MGDGSGHSRNLIYREDGGKAEEAPEGPPAHRSSAGLSIEGTGLITRNIEIDIFLVDSFVAVHSILLRIVIHGVVPPVEQGIGFGPVDRIPVITPGILLNEATGNIIDLAVPVQRVERKKEPSLVIVVLLDSCRKVRFQGQELLRPSTGHCEQEKKRDHDDGSR
jgi:hypothetical protein